MRSYAASMGNNFFHVCSLGIIELPVATICGVTPQVKALTSHETSVAVTAYSRRAIKGCG